MLAYALTVFVGAFLLLQVQPLMGKYLLPWFGGGPGVWTTCMLFYQVLLLGGYAYAHLLTRRLKPRLQVAVHGMLLILALAFLPIIPSEVWKGRGGQSPSLAILLLLACNIGVPYFVLSSTGPLLQEWSRRSYRINSPYGLYALSNLGSLLGLVTYPLFFEAHFPRQMQAVLWQWGLAAYCAGCGFCAVRFWRQGSESTETARFWRGSSNAVQENPTKPGTLAEAPTILRRLLWLLWPACSSVLLLATTNKLCLDVAAFPFLWVLPLSLYLLSFAICFASPKWYWRLPCTVLLAFAMVALCWALFKGSTWFFWGQVCVYSGGLFVCCVVCHGELYRIRPNNDGLTEFYLLIAAGGALGGAFVSLVAPVIFTNYYELHWGLAMCGLMVAAAHSFEAMGSWLRLDESSRGVMAGDADSGRTGKWTREWRPLGLALLWVCLFGLTATLWLQARRSGSAIVHKSRNFYGVLTVIEHRQNEPNGHHFLLQHGRITHGIQFVDSQLQDWPTTYYGPESGVALGLKALPAGPRRIGVIGLGTGSLAVYGRSGDSMRFYEINPQVARLATSQFTYLPRCRADCQVSLGDARLTLEKEGSQQFDLLALDAFSSDSIPTHLLTQEAFELYLRHVKTHGIIAVHTSNHFLDLEPVVLGLARFLQLQCRVVDHEAKPEQWWIYSSSWILLSRDAEVLNQPPLCSAAKALPAKPRELRLWTDDFSSLLPILR